MKGLAINPLLASPIPDVGDDTQGERGIDRQHLFGVDADLALAGHHRPVDLVVVLPGLDFGNVRHFVRLVLDRQVFGPADDRAGRTRGWMRTGMRSPPFTANGLK